jgi:hypothetical protein
MQLHQSQPVRPCATNNSKDGYGEGAFVRSRLAQPHRVVVV